ncbi:MAG: histidinol-phosphate transaminase [bacterium]
MDSMDILLRDNIQDLSPYPIEDHAYRIKLDANENPCSIDWAAWPGVMEGLRDIALNRYPDPHARALRDAISGYVNWPASGMILGNGSDELIQYILMAYGGPERPVYVPHPSFSMYRIIAVSMGQKFLPIPLGEGFELCVHDALLKELAAPPQKLVFIATPNNPTGNAFKREDVLAIVKATRGIVCIDEAYLDFCDDEGFLGVLPQFEQVIILRTLSKIGLAGLRVGILLANKSVIAAISKVRLPFNLNVVSQFLAREVLMRQDLLCDMIDNIRENRERLYHEMVKIPGLRVFPSQANFILFTCEGDVASMFHGLLAEGILIRMFPPEGPWPGFLRVTVGTRHECEIFIEALRRIMAQGGRE